MCVNQAMMVQTGLAIVNSYARMNERRIECADLSRCGAYLRRFRLAGEAGVNAPPISGHFVK